MDLYSRDICHYVAMGHCEIVDLNEAASLLVVWFVGGGRGGAMKKNRVRDWMTLNPVTIGPTATVPQARKLMTELSIRRLPVVERDRLVGIVTLGDLREAEASDAGLLSQFELKDLLAKQTVDRIMTWEPITALPDMTIQQAAQLMLAHKIAGLPIVENDLLIGIITESDIFRGLVQELSCEKAEQKAGMESVIRDVG